MPKDLLDLLWNAAMTLELDQLPDNNGNLPLHVAAANNQKHMCDKLLRAVESPSYMLRVKNMQGQTAAHVATEAVPHRIGPERHSIEKHEREKNADDEAKKAKDDDEHDFGLPILRLMWDITSKDGQRSGLLETDNDRNTCLHLAAKNGKSKHYVDIG